VKKNQQIYFLAYPMCVSYVFSETQMNDKKRVQVVFTPGQWELISQLRGEFGEGDADIVRNIVLAWLAEKSLISTNVKYRMGINGNSEERK